MRVAAALPAQLVRFERFAHAGHGVHWDEPRFFERIRELIAA
jgi:pimeloyl-ACP methyl ester carboxylesterase